MKVRPGRSARAADATNCLPSSDRIAGLDGGRGEMSVSGLDAVGVFDDDEEAVGAAFAGEGDLAGGGGGHFRSVRRSKIDTVMKLAAASEWIAAPAERGGRVAIERHRKRCLSLSPLPPLSQEGGDF